MEEAMSLRDSREATEAKAQQEPHCVEERREARGSRGAWISRW
jgi:hypothetical protein